MTLSGLSRLNNSPIRQYRPKLGTLVTMAEFADYTSRGLSPWGRLRVIGIDAELVTVQHAPSPLDVTKDTEQFTIPLERVQTPIGWEPRYTIYCKPEELDKALGWFARGLVVRQSHNMSGSMPTVFQPLSDDGTVPATPHWQFPEDTDTLTAEECKRLVRVVKVEREEVTSATLGYPPVSDCGHCHGTGRRTVTELASIRHDNPDTFRCHCHSDALGRMGRSKRARLFKSWESQGWTVTYQRFAGGYWERTRETVVRDWSEE